MTASQDWLREGMLAAGLVGLLLGSMFLATGSFPPMVVVESGSMMHDLDDGAVGSIDPGDLILVMNPDRVEIITYVEAKQVGNENYGYESLGMEGDVIIYRKNGGSDTPIIHRALLKAVAETTAPAQGGACTAGVYDGLEDICILTWSVPGTDINDVEEISMTLDYSCTPHGNLVIDRWVPNHEGYLTTGDNYRTNGCTIDQLRATSSDADEQWIRGRGLKDENGNPVTAVRDIWIEGISATEIPWIGAIKLFFSGTSSSVTSKSWSNLGLLFASVIAVPMLYEAIFENRKTDSDEEE
jgi:signal peptidase I|tara:strand:+ start:51 stop:944 length:894 start_codon:yes stop_codon:yes gene_type:complete